MNILHNRVKHLKVDRVLGIESRGFLFGPVLANMMGLSFVPIRKKGKLPGEVNSIEYQLEYGSDTLQVQKSSLPHDSHCLVVDDLMATGGTAKASTDLIEMNGSSVVAVAVLIELKELKGAEKLGKDIHFIRLFSY